MYKLAWRENNEAANDDAVGFYKERVCNIYIGGQSKRRTSDNKKQSNDGSLGRLVFQLANQFWLACAH